MDQTPEQLAKHLEDQVGFLCSSCAQYDRGVEAEAKRLAVSLRVLFHRSRNSTPLLDQLPGFEDVSMYDTPDPLEVSPHCNMSQLELVLRGGGKYYPRLDIGVGEGGRTKFTRRAEWWKKPVIRDFEGHVFTRADLVLSVADQDGGAHVDPKLNDPYASLTTQNSLQHKYQEGENVWMDPAQPVSACIRQIAHETLVSLALHSPSSFPRDELASQFRALAPSARDVYGVSGLLVGGMRVEVTPGAQSEPAAAKAKAGRNEPCPCGSGLKHKRCCGK